MSGLILEAAHFAKSKFGARVYVERGSRHIVSQAKILEQTGGQTPSRVAIERELASYKLADRIAVASGQVVDSFLEEDPGLAPKLFKNPYGVDLEQFPQRKAIPSGPPTVLFVGGWTYRKGVDVLSAALEQLPEARLIHVGGGGDVSFPISERFVHYDSVPQWRLGEFYAQAHVFAIASREEGLALVQLQALASGLPLVCTDRTGGADLSLTPGLASQSELSRVETRACSPRQSRPRWRTNHHRSLSRIDRFCPGAVTACVMLTSLIRKSQCVETPCKTILASRRGIHRSSQMKDIQK